MAHGEGPGKLRVILQYVIIAVVILLILMWLYAGGWANIKTAVAAMSNPLDIIWGNSTSTYEVKLPWQIDIPQGPDISGLTGSGDSGSDTGSSSQSLSDLQQQYADLSAQAQDAKNRGVPSPYQGIVTLSEASAAGAGVNEFVVLDGHGQAVNVSGWSLVSTLTGKRGVIPEAADPFVLGALNRVLPVMLGSGDTAIIATGVSPVGVSFRDNSCTGYLAQQQTFVPSLDNLCPSPTDLLPATEQNLQQYGSDCVDYVQNIPACEFPSRMPSSLPANCRAFVQNALSYNGCVSAHQYDSDFKASTYRLYLASGVDLWADRHDVIKLLDDQGRVVDAVQY